MMMMMMMMMMMLTTMMTMMTMVVVVINGCNETSGHVMCCTECPENFTHCDMSFCVEFDRFCDGHIDCKDGSDEIGCSKLLLFCSTQLLC
jgi:hypothetical protein